MKSIILIFFLFLHFFCFSQYTDQLQHIHIGKYCSEGSFLVENDKYTLSGVGNDIWNSTDEFDFAYVKIWGDIEITVRILSVENKNDYTKAGIMIREDLSGISRNVMLLMTPKNLSSYQYRAFNNSGCSNISIPNKSLPCWLRLTRKGNLFYSQISNDGKTWDLFEPVNIDMTGSVYYGLAVTGHAECQAAKAGFDNLNITKTISEIPQTISYHALNSSVFHSTYMKEDSKITVGLPYKYDSLQSTRYPILYYLDRNNPTYHNTVRDLSALKQIPDVITVGVGYFSASKRDSDYTVNFTTFHSFLKKELIPYIENHWNSDTLKRTIYGHSFGGLACLSTLFTYTNYNNIPFRNIVTSSPSIWWPDGKLAFSKEQNLSLQTSILPVNLYMSIGTNEDYAATSAFSKMARTIADRNYQYFNFMREANEGKNLATNGDISFRNGVIWALNQKVISPNSIATYSLERKNSDPMFYPNPTSGEVNIVFGSIPDANTKLELINLQGMIVYSKIYQDQSNSRLDLSKYPKGIYFIRLTNDGKTLIQKICLN